MPETKPVVNVILGLSGKVPESIPIAIETLARTQYRQVVAAIGTESILVSWIPFVLGGLGWIYIHFQERKRDEEARLAKTKEDQAIEEKHNAAYASEFVERFKGAVALQGGSEALAAFMKAEEFPAKYQGWFNCWHR